MCSIKENRKQCSEMEIQYNMTSDVLTTSFNRMAERLRPTRNNQIEVQNMEFTM